LKYSEKSRLSCHDPKYILHFYH